jgi:hypothetical protein
MATTVTIDEETLAKLGDLKGMLREMGCPRHFKRDIVEQTVDDLHETVRQQYYEQKARPHLQARRIACHGELFTYWTPERVLDELAMAQYREEYREQYGATGDARYVADVQATLARHHEAVSQFVNNARSVPEDSVQLVPLTTPEAPVDVHALRVHSDALPDATRQHGIGNACERAVQRVEQTARLALGGDNGDTPHPWSVPTVLVETPDYWASASLDTRV